MRRYPIPQNRHFRFDAGQSTKPIRFLSSVVAVDATTTVSVVTLTRTGKFFDPRYGKFEITSTMLLAMVTNFNSGVFGQDIFIDRAHNANGGAAGTIQRLFLDGGKLRAEVAWTTYGMELIEQKGYRYLSAEFIENFISNEEPHAEHGTTLLGAGLCVRPCIKNLDRIELAEPDADYEGYQLISRQLATQLYEGPQMEKYIKLLKEALAAKKLSEAMKLIETPIVTKAENTNEIIELRKHSAGATKVVIGKADALALTPRIYVRQLFLIFCRSICRDAN
jgi:hypothetical protein